MSSKARYEPHRGSPYLVQAAPGFLESVPDEETPESLYDKHETVLKEELGRMLARLPTTEAEAIAKWLSGMTQAQIAAQDGVTQAAISIRAKRGLEKLFEMRDRGELGTLEFIWNGLNKIRDHIDHEIALEHAADSDTSLPLGEALGEELGEKVRWVRRAKCPADVGDGFDDPPLPPPSKKARLDADRKALPLTRLVADIEYAPASTTSTIVAGPATTHVDNETGKRTKLKCSSILNTKEQSVLSVIEGSEAFIHIKGIERDAKLTNLEVRNSLRKLVRTSMVSKLGKGLYRCAS